MELGMIGLGKMGLNLALNLTDGGHRVLGYDPGNVSTSQFETLDSLEAVVDGLKAPRVVWVMVPAGDVTERVLNDLHALLSPGDIVIDGGNSNYKESMRRAEHFNDKLIYFFDVGTSGGMEGARNGACTMIGGDIEAFGKIEELFQDVSTDNGYLYAGPSGSGHFLKMIHNGIEYGMMQAIAEGFEILEKSLFDYDHEQVARVWNHGSVVRSWLMELTESAFHKDAKLDEIKGVMHASGEGKWTVETALEYGVPAPVIAMSLMMRQRSLEEDTFSGKVVAALRNEFGGHAVEKK
ncbi:MULTISPECIES: phosphogluconate dehydrogenase (NAD(+)-dependent, decarboxylating) [unclassified Exiguobacterium]|uniref:phosphogluconate dehydrogenase (NAD(+)-dependent, decarboxylating) n=1 Tax=unclassified Exiguobacterium TaxID=2644629 RepID=UPI00103F3CBA|nr:MULTISPECIES: decarboxylating 6-phosphogluconate dehydrogenase [unclassified Exiguobacterium]TCI48287.1 decarboxylating 6-phosphogluconate dehydrogenase [Exiguobacterium sp. SH5S32]TCI55174.1 decarboxylating 6-phosphogluconate dehydrogenase [Exiguobacterium sp. SH1S4]TCI74967.1 decarboxylating 6-phosphogluconate dehydrogenase [Exiguobacterium sp. SH1S1]